MRYFPIFLIIETIIGVSTATLQSFFVPSLLLTNTPPGQTATPGVVFTTLIIILFVSALISVVLGSIATGIGILISSQIIENKSINLRGLVWIIVKRLLSIWALTIIVGIIVFLGLLALIVPGIILAIMFSLALPVLLIENIGVTESMGRSRQLVGGRWLKSFGIYLVMGLIIGVISLAVSGGTAVIPFPFLRTIVTSIISAFYAPLMPILLAVYYYSNRVRLTMPPGFVPGYMPVPQYIPRYCPSCGQPLHMLGQGFCTNCGADLRSNRQ